jgi:phospholipid-translocating ATPase
MSFLRRNNPPPEDLTDEENDDTIDPELRLRTVRTAASAIAESIRSEQRAQRRKSSRRGKASRFFRKHERRPEEVATEAGSTKEIPGVRRNVHVNHPLSAIESNSNGEPLTRYKRNKVRTTSKFSAFYIRSRCAHHYFRIHHPHIRTQKLVRAIPTVRSHIQPIFYTIHTVLTWGSRVANLFFLTIVILQSECP